VAGDDGIGSCYSKEERAQRCMLGRGLD
jgi:hypothetical protein